VSKQSPRPLVERADAGFGRFVRPGSFATGSSQQQVRPCPLYRRKRLNCCAATKRRDVPLAEVTRFYSITSSARTSSVGGTVIPIERAVFRFMDSLIRVGS
jgi:hypothetical protein